MEKRILRSIGIALLQVLALKASANVLGNMQTFAPNPDSMIFQNIHSSQTLEKNYFNVGFFAAYVRNELSVYDNLTNPRFVEYKDKATTFDLVFAWGITRYLELTYSMPGYFSQSPDSGQLQQNYISSGINGHRIGFKYNLSKDPTGGFAVAGSADLTQTEDNPYIGNNVAPIWNAELIWDKRDQSSGYGFNLGYRKRDPGSPVANAYFLPVSDQLIASAGYVWGLATRWRFHVETFGSYALKKDNHPDQTYISSLEALVGGKYRLARNLWGHFGTTAEAIPKGLAPDYRLYAGINYFFGFAGENKTSDPSKSSFEVNPREMNLAQQEKQTVTVSGGTAPYTYELSKKLGNFDQDIMEYTAGNQKGNEELIVRDADGASAVIPITIRDRSSLSITPSDSTVYTGGVVQYVVNGGKGPYRASLSPASFGSISNLRYIAPTKDGEVEVTIRDQRGQTATARIHVVPIPKSSREINLKNLNFDFNTDRLTKSSQKELDRNIAAISEVKIKKMIVVGHTDSKGSDIYNQNLSQKRAETVAKILRSRFHLRTEQVEAVGYGESQPIATNNTEAGRLKNRRCELKLYFDE